MAGGSGGGSGHSITLAWSLQSEPPGDLRIVHQEMGGLGRSGTGTGERGSASRKLQSPFACALWTSHKIYFAPRKSKFCSINTNPQTRAKAEEKPPLSTDRVRPHTCAHTN